jgi:hypothetical protein
MNIQELAEQCHKTDGWPEYREFDYKKFAELVAAHEREECAKLCEENMFFATGEQHAKAIRARGKA